MSRTGGIPVSYLSRMRRIEQAFSGGTRGASKPQIAEAAAVQRARAAGDEQPDNPDVGELRKLPVPNGESNAFLWVENGGRIITDKLSLWVYDISADFSLTGNTAQSEAKRDFYPHNFDQPTFTILGQTHNHFRYTDLTWFIRKAQRRCLFEGAIMVFSMPRSGIAGPKGRTPGIQIEGYVMNVPRQYERFVNAPEFQIQFVVSRMRNGPMRDEPVTPPTLPTDWDSFLRRNRTGFIVDPDDVLLKRGRDEGASAPTKESHTPNSGNKPDWDPNLLERMRQGKSLFE